MWDDHKALRQLANALLWLSAGLVLFGAVHVLLHLPLFPLRVVKLDAAPQRVAVDEVDAVLHQALRGTFFTADLERVRQGLEQLPWVRKVSVRRSFPARLEISIEEHQAFAHWNGSALVNAYGEVFQAETEQVLPQFVGQPEMAAEMVAKYAELTQQVAPLQRGISQIRLSPRHAWRLKLDNGMVLELGREDIEQRLARFVSVYRYSLAALPYSVNYVDLRYRDGFAVYAPGMTEKLGNRGVKGKV